MVRSSPYVNQGWIPLRKLLTEIDISSGTLDSYVKLLNIEVYKPLHQLSFISKEDREKILNFINEHRDTTERKIYLSKQTCIGKYGVDNFAYLDSHKEKMSKLNKENAKERLEKAKKTNIEKYGVENYFQIWDNQNYWSNLTEEEKQIRNNKISKGRLKYRELESDKLYIQTLSELFDKDSTGVANSIRKLGICIEDETHPFIWKKDLQVLENYYKTTELSGTSFEEKELSNFIRSIYSEETIENDRKVLNGKELDIYIPSKNIAIEYNGIFWHSQKDKNYHLNKTKECNNKNIRLIQFWDTEWNSKKDICKSIISSSLGINEEKIFARKCEIKEIPIKEWKEFLSNNHIQGYTSAEYRYGLYFNGELKQGIGLSRKSHKKGELELNRMCTKLNTQVVGGFSKLTKFASKTLREDIVSYIDIRLFNGKGYINSGFEIVKINEPTYYYTNFKLYEGKLLHPRYTFMKKNIKKDFDKGLLSYWDENETEEENMSKNKFYRLWNCGTVKVIYKCNFS